MIFIVIIGFYQDSFNFIWNLFKKNSYEWFIPFSYSIEKTGLNINSLANSVNMSNLHDQIIWLEPNGNKESKTFYDFFIYKEQMKQHLFLE